MLEIRGLAKAFHLRDSDVAAVRLPRAYLVYVYDAAHGIDTDQPDRFVGLVKDFLGRGEAFIVNQGVAA